MDLSQVQRAASEVLSRASRIDGLLLNAAVFGGDYKQTVQGHEATFGVNHLSHYLLVELLKEKLVESGTGSQCMGQILGCRFDLPDEIRCFYQHFISTEIE